MTQEETPQLTPEEQEELDNIMANYPKMEEKLSTAWLLNQIRISKDTTKTANLSEEEIIALRNLMKATLYSNTMGLKQVGKYFHGLGEVISAPTLSRNATFIKALITQKKELETKSTTKENKGWFKKKDNKEGEKI